MNPEGSSLEEGRYEGAPLPVWTMRWCPKCGRTNASSDLKARHFAGGTLCDGKPVKLVYRNPEVQADV